MPFLNNVAVLSAWRNGRIGLYREINNSTTEKHRSINIFLSRRETTSIEEIHHRRENHRSSRPLMKARNRRHELIRNIMPKRRHAKMSARIIPSKIAAGSAHRKLCGEIAIKKRDIKANHRNVHLRQPACGVPAHFAGRAVRIACLIMRDKLPVTSISRGLCPSIMKTCSSAMT